MKQIISLALALLPCLAWAQYPSNGNQKITLGEQTTADGLIYRGVLADTGIITPLSDTSAYIILDTVNHRFYNYNRATNVWSMAGVGSISSGLTGVLPVANGGTGSATQNFVDLTTTQTVAGVKTFSNAMNVNGDLTLTASGFQPMIVRRGVKSIGAAVEVPMRLQNGTSNYVSYAALRAVIIDTTTNSEDGSFQIHTTINGEQNGRFEVRNNGNVGIDLINDAITPTEKLHVKGNGLFTGNVGIGGATPTASGSGITFPATQSASTNVNTLDDYEEGTFTPSWVSSGATFVYDAAYRHGRYTKIGNTVYVSFHISTSEVPGGTITNAVTVSGMPFVSGNVDNSHFSAFNYGYLYNIDWPASKTQATAIMNRNASAVAMYWEQDSTASTQWLASALRAGSYLIINGFYFVP